LVRDLATACLGSGGEFFDHAIAQRDSLFDSSMECGSAAPAGSVSADSDVPELFASALVAGTDDTFPAMPALAKAASILLGH